MEGIRYETYQINMFGGMALQNCKQRLATVPYNERCTLIIYNRGKESLNKRGERERKRNQYNMHIPRIIIAS